MVLIRLIAAITVLFATGCDLTTRSTDIGVHLSSGRAYFEQGQFNAAMIESRAALQIDPTNESALILLAEINLTLGAPQQAIAVLQQIEGTTLRFYELMAEIHLARGKFASAILLLREQARLFEQDPVSATLIDGEARLGLQDVVEARASFQRALDAEPGNVDAILGLITVKVLTGDLARAEQELLDLIAAHPDRIDPRTLLAAVYIRQGRTDQAEVALTDAISLLPSTDRFTRERVVLVQNMIRLLAHRGRSGEALVYQEMLADAFPNAEGVRDKMAEVIEKLQSGDFDSALQLLDQVDAVAPGNETTGTLRGVIAFLRGDHERADELFSSNVDVEIASGRTLQLFATNQFRLNRPHRVVEILRDHVKDSTDADTLALFGIAAISADLPDEGVAALRKAIDLAPDRVRLSVVLAQHLDVQDPAAALAELENAYSIDPDDIALKVALLGQYLKMDRVNEARRFVDGLFAAEPESPTTHLLAATYFSRIGDLPRAEENFRLVIASNPDDNTARFGLAQILLEQDRYSEAEQVYREIVKLDPESPLGYLGLLQTYVDRGEQSAGITVLTEIAQTSDNKAALVALSSYFASINQEPNAERLLSQARAGGEGQQYWKQANANLHLRKARRNLAERNYDEARRDAFTALSSYPANLQLLSLLAEIEIEAGSLREAQKVIEQIADMHPGSRLLRMREGDLAMAQGNLESARTHYEVAWEKESGDRLGQSLYTAYVGLGLDELAGEFLQKWEDAVPDSVAVKVNIAERFERRGDLQSAINVYKGLLERIPGSETALNNLAWLYIQADQFKDAVAVSERAYRNMPGNGYIADTYGWALFKADRPAEAADVLERALALVDDAEIQAHLNEVRRAIEGP